MGVHRTSYRFLLLILWMLEVAINEIVGKACSENCQQPVPELVGVLGTSVYLSCVYPEKKTFLLDTLMVYWQINEKQVIVHTFISDQDNITFQHHRYKDRTRMFESRLKEGDFSLQLSNVTLTDTAEYMCVVMRRQRDINPNRTTECIHQNCVFFKVAAHFSPPVLAKSGDFLNCSSSDGHPKPNLHWINGENGSALDPSLSATVIERNPDTQRYSVRSLLRINTTTLRNISCWVENTMLMENLTAYLVRVVDPVGSTETKGKQISGAVKATAGVLGTMAIVLVLVVVFILLFKKNICGAYRGVAQVEREQQQMEDQRTSLNEPAGPEAMDGTSIEADTLH